jgi:hypothetical protein
MLSGHHSKAQFCWKGVTGVMSTCTGIYGFFSPNRILSVAENFAPATGAAGLKTPALARQESILPGAT